MWRSRQAERPVAQQPAAEQPAPERPVARDDYRTERLEVLRELVRLDRDEGLEVGAFDFPTVQPGVGRCEIADSRTSEELSRLFSVPLENVAPVKWLLERGRPLAEQIPRRFDYVILCHVLEHVPEPIRFLNEIGALLRPGGIALLAVPDKRRTADASRPSTTIDHLLERHYHGATEPPLAQIMEFARAWNDDLRKTAAEEPHEFYAWAVRQVESGHADVHCNVWQDTELFAQLDLLVQGGFLPGLEVCARKQNAGGFNEFYVALRRSAAGV